MILCLVSNRGLLSGRIDIPSGRYVQYSQDPRFCQVLMATAKLGSGLGKVESGDSGAVEEVAFVRQGLPRAVRRGSTDRSEKLRRQSKRFFNSPTVTYLRQIFRISLPGSVLRAILDICGRLICE